MYYVCIFLIVWYELEYLLVTCAVTKSDYSNSGNKPNNKPGLCLFSRKHANLLRLYNKNNYN